ncbi:hypothetical protein FE257_001436 [Aspergillus nanangensis]|uniref:Uncharacterized protein n=1 Tax=Aspergillus nanangensis TaxID=2582783 RepID=A0AAD4CDR5_ASPNN|nr:hypothetical protein FE257_001436 [Aspergillus nanangensis]
MRWTLENEAKLLRVLLETQNIVINPAKIVEGWDGDEEKPTIKAIKEHLGKFKKTLKPGASLSLTGKTGGESANSTPRKRKATASTVEGEDEPIEKTKKKTKSAKVAKMDDELSESEI